ncbi:hypothetical protein JHL17_13105 [Azospirillum sp. YIM B02556]|uniref:Glycosyltransferase RgtA/B/C/D-like domain-containing protein n=1 Tax=Azospirillum endophyticum TaxID=2800326 RepID=A0ABS1F4P5_9PROT|nr:hypothetical protein [Azospirillum endophyticum]MBK1838354.1 hypothetical protein [Azospirillum endophyticum]
MQEHRSQGRQAHRRLASITGGLLVLLGALLYYAGYIDAGFNTADDGHYAQVAYELWLGTDPHALRFGYGLLWFKIGEGLFALGGPSWLAVQWLFQGASALAGLLVYAAVLKVTGRMLPALLGAGVAVAVPAFPPTVFYAVCVLLNVFLQVHLAERWRRMAPADLIAPAAGLSVTFQIRPDFGFVFAATLGGLVLLGAAASGRQALAGRLARLAGAGLAVSALAQAPLMAMAAAGGYLDLIVGEYLRYPDILLRYLSAGLGGGAGGTVAADAGGAGTLLGRPPLSDLLNGSWTANWSGGTPTAAMALLVHLPLATAAGFALLTLARLRRAESADGVPARLVVLAGGVAALPHYYLFRPDLAHIANFMPGHIVLVCVLLADLTALACRAGRGPAGLAKRAGALGAGALPGFGLAVYLWVGLTMPGTGSIANAAGRTVPFAAQNGVAVRVSPGERPLLEGLREAVEAHSSPGDRIVCVPFCPGVAFMTGRRMLLRDWYVDDSLLITDPGWIDRAIASTREARPPVVVVVDWAINGTEISRFANWARPYVAMLDATATGRVELPGITVYLMPR